MRYEQCFNGVFIKRINRFLALVFVNEREEEVHVKNTGRLQELLVAGARVVLTKSENPNRKTRYSLIAVYKGNTLFQIDSQSPNAVAEEALREGAIKEIGKVDFIKREAVFQHSRFDFYFEKGSTKGYMEVKGVTLCEGTTALFPDAPTLRGKKHVEELICAAKQGYQAVLLFLVQSDSAQSMTTNAKSDTAFAMAVKKARNHQVQILVYDCLVREEEIRIGKPLPFFST